MRRSTFDDLFRDVVLLRHLGCSFYARGPQSSGLYCFFDHLGNRTIISPQVLLSTCVRTFGRGGTVRSGPSSPFRKCCPDCHGGEDPYNSSGNVLVSSPITIQSQHTYLLIHDPYLSFPFHFFKSFPIKYFRVVPGLKSSSIFTFLSYD